MDKVRVALVGAGSMANSVHYPSLHELDDVELVGLCDLVEEKLQQTADRFEIDKRYRDYQKMLEETAPDAVYVLMPPHQLFDLAVHCLREGFHLFIEKPPGITTFQARMMAQWAEKRNCITMVGFQRRHIPLLVRCKEKVEERGPIHQCVCSFYKNQIGADPYFAGSVDVLTCDAIHAVDTLRWMAGGEAVSVASDVRSLGVDYENAFNALIRFSSGATGVLLSNWAVGRRFFTVEMHAQTISAFADPDDKGTVYADNDQEGEVLEAKEVAGSEELRKYYGFFQENRHFIDCILSKTQPISCLEDSIRTMELVDQIYASAMK